MNETLHLEDEIRELVAAGRRLGLFKAVGWLLERWPKKEAADD